MRLIVLLCFIGVYFTSKAQTVRYVDYTYQSDINVFFVDNKWDADAIVYVSNFRFSPPKLGVWYEEKFFQFGGVKVHVTKIPHHADLKIYRTKWKYEIKVNDRYMNKFKLIEK